MNTSPLRILSSLTFAVVLAAPSPCDVRYVVYLDDGASIQPVCDANGMAVVKSQPGGPMHLIAPPYDPTPEEQEILLAALQSAPGVEFAELDRLSYLADEECLPPPPDGVQQCTIGFVDGTPTSSEYHDQAWLHRVDVFAARSLAPSIPVIVAVIDSGLDLGHSTFEGRLVSEGYDFVSGSTGAWEVADGIDNDGDGFVDEAFGHGTHVAGTILLINPNAVVLPLRVADSEGRASAYDVAAAIEYAIAQGAQIINLSLSFEMFSQAVAEAAHHAVREGVSVFTSSGNTGGAVLFPANLSSKEKTKYRVPGKYSHGVTSIAAIDEFDVLAGFSARGERVDLSVPGIGIYGPYPGGAWARWNGTSMACAVASGIASLVEACDPNPSRSAAELMIETAINIDAYNQETIGAMGWGIPNALAAVEAVH